MAKVQKERKVTIRHIMADGTVRDSIEGFVIPYEQCPEAYHIIHRLNMRLAEEREAERCILPMTQ